MRLIRSINPANGKLIAEFNPATHEQASLIVKHALKGFSSWSKLNIQDRCAHLLAFSDILKEQSESLAALITEEMGKPIKESRQEIQKCVKFCKIVSESASEWLKDEQVSTDASKSFIRFEPLGVILAIEPWNYPFWQAVRAVVPILAAGNTAILKHSSVVPRCALKIAQLFEGAGLPSGVFQTVLGHADIAQTIMGSEIAGVAFTGGTDAGRAVARFAGGALKKVVAELGGSDAFLVLEDADIERACAAALAARFKNAGQSCTAAKRIIVHEKIWHEFLEKFVKGVSELVVGDPLDENTDIGPLATEQQITLLQSQIKDSVYAGAKLLLGGKRIKKEGFWFEPGVLVDARPGMRAWDEETFGPLAVLCKAASEEEAIELANETNYGLGATIWCARERAEQLVPKIRSGLIFVNSVPSSDPAMPFGGIKESGWGREMSRYGILEWTNIKSVKIF